MWVVPYAHGSVIENMPLELMERVFKIMAHTDLSLSSCILVSRSWARLAYPYRFEELVFSLTAAPQNAVWQKGHRRPGQRTCEDLIAFLRTTTRISALVESVFLRADDPDLELDVRCVPKLIRLLPRLHTLEIANCQMMCTPRRLEMTDLFSPRPLKMLQIGEVAGRTRTSAHALAFVIACFEAVEFLHIEYLLPAFGDQSALWVLGVFFGTQVTTLNVGTTNWLMVDAALGILGQTLEATSLREINLTALDMGDTTVAQRFLESHGKQVKRLHCGSFNECAETRFDLSPCASLETLEVSVCMPYGEVLPDTHEQFATDWPIALRTLQSAPKSIKCMTLKILIIDAGDRSTVGDDIDVDDVDSDDEQTLARLSAMDWFLLDGAIDAHPGLMKVEFCVRLLVDFDEDEAVGAFYKDVEALIAAKCFATEKRKKLLNFSLPEGDI